MVYITGDLHGDIARFRSKAIGRIKKGDTLIACGDFGFIWDGSKKETRLLKWLGKQKFTILFIEGTHDNLKLIDAYPKTAWNGGMVHEIAANMKHLCRGGVFVIEDEKYFVFGGGESDDMDERLADGQWWPEELPSEGEIAEARRNLSLHGNQVDYIITHQISRKIKRFLTMLENEANILDTFFDEVRAHCKYKRWFFGGYHINKVIPPSEMAVFSAVVPVTANKL